MKQGDNILKKFLEERVILVNIFTVIVKWGFQIEMKDEN